MSFSVGHSVSPEGCTAVTLSDVIGALETNPTNDVVVALITVVLVRSLVATVTSPAVKKPEKLLPKKYPPTAYAGVPEKLNSSASVARMVEIHLSDNDPTEASPLPPVEADTEIPPTLKLYGLDGTPTGVGRDSNVSVPKEVTAAKNNAGSV